MLLPINTQKNVIYSSSTPSFDDSRNAVRITPSSDGSRQAVHHFGGSSFRCYYLCRLLQQLLLITAPLLPFYAIIPLFYNYVKCFSVFIILRFKIYCAIMSLQSKLNDFFCNMKVRWYIKGNTMF